MNKIIKFVLALLLYVVISKIGYAQMDYSIALTYASPGLKSSPGLEYGLHIKKHKFYLSGSYFFDQPKPNQIANISNSEEEGLNHYGLGYGYRILENDLSFDLSIHLLRHLGPRYDEIDFYAAGGYYIYRKTISPTFGVPVSVNLVYKKMFLLLNYDLGTGQFRYGIGVLLHSKNN